MCLRAERGDLGVKPDCAIFADTRWEPSAVYKNLDWLEGQVSFPIIRTDNGRDLRQDGIDGVNAQGQPWMSLPVYLADEEGKASGINWRQCTKNYKIAPIRRKVQQLLGLEPRQTIAAQTSVEMWLGITKDEALRTKPSREWWIRHRYPLIDDLPMSREDCERLVCGALSKTATCTQCMRGLSISEWS